MIKRAYKTTHEFSINICRCKTNSIKWIDIERTFSLKTRPHSDDPECSGLQSIKDTGVVYVSHSRDAAEFEKKMHER